MQNQILAYLYSGIGIPLSNKRILNKKLDVSQKHHAKWKKPDTNHYWNQINVWFHLCERLLKENYSVNRPVAAMGWETAEGHKETFGGDGSPNS